MLTLCLYVYYTEKPVIKRYLPVVFSFVVALMSKPMVVTLPVIMILLDYWPLGRFELRKSDLMLWQLREKIPFFILSAVLVFITLYNPSQQDTSLKAFSLIPRLANAPVAFVTYLEKTFWPHDMAVFYPFSDQLPVWQVLEATILIIVISVTVIVMAKRLPYLFVGWMWYAITIAPVIGIIQISVTAPYAMADRYHYLPSIGIAVILAWGIPLLIMRENARKKILFMAATAFLMILAVLTWNQCGYWKNSSELWNHALHVTKDNYLAHNNLGFALAEKGKIQEAIDHYNKAIRLKPDYFEAYNNRGNVYANLGQYQLALGDYNEAIRLKPNAAVPYYNKGCVYAKLSQYQQAIEDFNEAIRLRPNYADAYNNRATAYVNMGQYQLAIKDYNKAITVKPDYADAYKNREFVYSKLGKQHTLEDYNEAIRSRPDFAYYYNDRGNSYAKLGQDQRAIEDYTKAISLKRDCADAYNNRGVAYAKLGQYQRAIDDFNKAIYIKQDYADAYNNRGITYFKQGNNKQRCNDIHKACELGKCKILEAARNSGDCL